MRDFDLDFSDLPEKTEKSKFSNAPSSREREIIRRLNNVATDPETSWLKEMVLQVDSGIILSSPTLSAEPTCKQIRDNLKKELNKRFEKRPDLLEVIMEVFPSEKTIANWRADEEYKEACWSLVKDQHLFSPQKRTEVVKSLHENATINKNVNAAKVWLTLSGDYVEKSETTDKTIDTYREIQEAILKRQKNG